MKLICLLLIIANLVLIVAPLYVGGDFDEWKRSEGGRLVGLVFLALAAIGVIYFIVDAFRRDYLVVDELIPKTIASAGLLSFGFFSIVYCMIWGWREREFAFASKFCDQCKRESVEYNQQLDLTSLNWIHGGHLLGSGQKCETCGSTIKTHCYYICGVPILVRGSFRVQHPGMQAAILRKRAFYWPHLFRIGLIPVFVLVCVTAAMLSK